MVSGFYDNDGRFIPGSSVGSEYELEPHDKAAIEDIKKQLKKGYKSEEAATDSLEFLENLNKKLSDAIRNEGAAGNDNWTLKAAQESVVALAASVKQEMRRLSV